MHTFRTENRPPSDDENLTAFFLALLVASIGSTSDGVNTISPRKKVPTVSYCDLIRNPEVLQRKHRSRPTRLFPLVGLRLETQLRSFLQVRATRYGPSWRP